MPDVGVIKCPTAISGCCSARIRCRWVLGVRVPSGLAFGALCGLTLWAAMKLGVSPLRPGHRIRLGRRTTRRRRGVRVLRA